MKKYKFFSDNFAKKSEILSKERYEFNCGLERSFSGLIHNQHTKPQSRMKYGKKYTLAYNGCEVVAIYNALDLIGKTANLAEIVYEFEENKFTAFNLAFLKSHPTKLKILPYIFFLFSKLNLNFKSGAFGTNPFYLNRFFDAHKINYRFFTNLSETLPEENIFIVSFWNECKCSSMVHTFVVKRDNSGFMRTINGYCDSKLYKNLSEIENGGAKFICGYALKGETNE